MSIEIQQIEPLLPHWYEIGCNLTRKQSSAPIPVMAIRAAISDKPELTLYRQWLTTETSSQRSGVCSSVGVLLGRGQAVQAQPICALDTCA